jgi:hypothetical protein
MLRFTAGRRGYRAESLGPEAEARVAARFAATGRGRRVAVRHLGEALLVQGGRAGPLVLLSR